MILDVAIPLRVAGTFHYKVPQELLSEPLSSGSLVEVRFRNKLTHAFVLNILDDSPVPRDKILPIQKIIATVPALPEELVQFLAWTSQYYCHPIGEVMSAALPRMILLPLNETKRKRRSPLAIPETERDQPPILTKEQEEALKSIQQTSDLRPALLHGVTGSGKTEVYLHAINEILKLGKTALILVPEIALTPQLVQRFAARFGEIVSVLHSELSDKDRQIQWNRVLRGQSSVVIGARSAIFAPLKNLGLIVVDEEHEGSYKQEDSFRYQARDLAIARGKQVGAKVLLGSATPSLESYAHAQSGKYQYVRMAHRVSRRPLPRISFVDMKNPDEAYSSDFPWITRTLLSAIQSCLTREQQALLYLNRLGYGHFLFCKDCGHTWRCKNCDVSLTYYQRPPLLKCHYCGHIRTVPKTCDSCQGVALEPLGLGTEKVEGELQKLMPKARILRFDRSQIRSRKTLEESISRIRNRDVDIIIGTQMITKGHDFPFISLVGILAADASLNVPDFRAQERTFQILTQVAGRAGRGDVPGEVLVQTYHPEHPVLLAAAQNDVDLFYRNELRLREALGFPPSSRLMLIRFQHKHESKVRAFAEASTNSLKSWVGKNQMQVEILGPSESPISRVKGVYRWQTLVRAKKTSELQWLARTLIEWKAQSNSPVQTAVDMDPVQLI